MNIMIAVKDIAIKAVPGAGYVVLALSRHAEEVVGKCLAIAAAELEECLDCLREAGLNFGFER